AGIGVLRDQEYTEKNIRTIVENREFLTEELTSLGFELTDSRTNFVFARHPQISGEKIYLTLKERGVLVRHFTSERIREYNRITIGSREELMALLTELRSIIREELR
ncbi:MAG: aminotransferase class I/II-fold pyridoxal phosphate-dependent enzyme, partial [Oscillospiraceae bacterium]|nr:aminotransferase class I/II-fold pyridoxal phosphate-dependent enzyme [Oscillospiraceae bacterium]